MLIPLLLLATQVATPSQDSTYSSAALATMVSVAAQANRRVPQPLTGYRANIESEIALLVNTPAGPDGAVAGTAAATTEAAAQIEQFQMQVVWDRSGRFEQQVIGYRARQLGPMVSALTIMPRPWTSPALYGDRMSLVFGGGPSFRAADSTRRLSPSVHPFASDRARYYRFSGGDTVVKIRALTRVIPVVQINVEPVAVRERITVFAGQVFVDAMTGEIVRMRGRIKLMSPPGEGTLLKLARLVGQVQEVAFIDFENSEQEGRYWLPRKQRIEYQVTTGLTEARATVRVQSTWRDMRLELRPLADLADSDTIGAPQYRFRMPSADSTTGFTDWRYDLGTQTTDASARDFDDVAPPALRTSGPPQWRWQARGFTDVIRLNRAEGLFLGAAGLLDFREKAPGVSVRVFGGWATAAQTAKGGLEAARVRGKWVTNLRAERQLASTNDLSLSLGGVGGNLIGGLFGREDHDWVDRRVTSLGVMREFGVKHSSALRIEIGAGDDRGIPDPLTKGLISGEFRPNRPVDEGGYVRSRVQFDFGRNIVTGLLASGVGASVWYERGDGTLDWQRAQVQALVQRIVGRVILVARADAGAVTGSNVPTQQFLEVGGGEGLPGYEYKEFAGSQALIVRSTAAYLLPIFESPMRLGRVVLPAIAPQLQIGMFGGATAVTQQTRPVLEQQGWITTDRLRGSADIRLRFFSGAISVGASRAVDRRDRWKLVFGVGGSL